MNVSSSKSPSRDSQSKPTPSSSPSAGASPSETRTPDSRRPAERKPNESSSPAPSESVSLSRETQEPSTETGVENLLGGLAEWGDTETTEAGTEDGSASEVPEEESPSLELNEGELLGQGQSSSPEQVTQLQEMLNSRGQQLEVDGRFGPRTAEAVREVQQELGVTVDGIVGPETMGALNGGNGSSDRAGGNVETPGVPGEVGEAPEVETGEAAGETPETADGATTSGATLEGLPERAQDARGGAEFMSSIEGLPPGPERDQAVLQEILSGNIPENSRTLEEITVNRDGREITMNVMRDYLAIGSNEDNVRIPMTPGVAQAIADRTGTSLPTDRIVEDIHNQANRQLHMDPMGASSRMSSIGWYGDHDSRLDRQLGSGVSPTELVSGHKKDLVIPARDGQVAIYGGRWESGGRIQSYSNVHGDTYEDYSHGARLVGQEITIDGQSMTLADALADPSLRSLFTSQSGNFGY